MADITEERTLLLDKLYNLKGDDSIITVKINNDIEDLNNRISDTTNEKTNEEERKVALENQLATFTEQSSQFLETFSAYDNSSFESLKEVNIDIELGTLLAELRQSVPTHKEELNNSIQESENTIINHTNHIEELNNSLEQSKNELSEAETVKSKLNTLLNDIIVNHNDSYNRGYVKKLLDDLNVFNDEEKNSLEYLILFPENGLAEFDANYSSREHTNPFEIEKEEVEEIVEEPVVEEPIEETTAEVEETSEYVEEIKEDDLVVEPIIEEKTFDFEDLKNEIAKEEENIPFIEEPISPIINPIAEPELNLTEEETVVEEEPIAEDKDEDIYAEVKSNLEKLNLDINEFKNDNYENIMDLLKDTEYGVLALNLELLKSIEVNEGVIYKYFTNYNYMYIADPEFSKKISLIRSKGINDRVIKEQLAEGNFTYSLSVMKDRIEALKTTGNELTEKNVGDLKADIIGFYKNILALSDLGFELDDKEIRNFRAVLANSPYISENAELLKEHLVKLVQKNGKYAMNVFWNNPKDLELGIETLEEAGLSNLLEQNPEVLSTNSEMVVRRTNYCLENNMPINENDDETEYCDYIVDALSFYRTFENVELPTIPSTKDNNKVISTLTENQEYTNMLIDTLNTYYSADDVLDKIEITDNDLENTYNDITSIISNTLQVTTETDRVYDVSGILISKSKVLRNIKILLDELAKKNQPVTGLEKEIILTSSLYNLRVSKEQLEMVARNCLGDIKLSKELGGNAA